MLKENMKHIILVIIAIVMIGVGYLNYHYEDSMEVAATMEENQVDENTIGDVQFVSANSVKEELVPNDEVETNADSTNSDDYFAKTKLERDTMYSQMLETYQKMVDSHEIANDQKAIAMQEISNITTIQNAIMIAENLIKNKNFEDVVILVSNNHASIVVKSSSLNNDQIAQIQNIVCRELDIKVENINISQK